MADDGPQAKRSKQGPPVAATMARVQSYATGVDRAHLPERCDPRWFRDTFCDGRGADLGANDDVWDLVVGFNLYDVIALLACSPSLRRRHFAPHAHTVRGATHYIVGLGSAATHVRDTDNLSKALADGVRDGLVERRRPGPAA